MAIELGLAGKKVSLVSFGSSEASDPDFEGTLDANGQLSVSVANANTYNAGAWYQETPELTPSGIYRINPSDTDEIIFEADLGALAEGKIIAGKYWLAS